MPEKDETKESVGGEEIKATPPSSVSDGYNKFIEKQAAAKEESKEDPPAVKDAETSKEGETKEEKPGEKVIRMVDKDGNEVPFEITVDGKLIQVTDLEKLKKYSQLGYHSDTRGKELNDREVKLKADIATFAQGQELLKKIEEGIKDGRLVMNDPASKVEETPEIDEELFSDPAMLDLKKENLALAKSLKDLQGQVETTNKVLLGKLVEEQHGKIVNDIARLTSEYGLADENEVWDLLAVQNADGTPKHTVEEAMKISSEKEEAKFSTYVKKDPSMGKLNEEEKQAAVKDYLEKKAKREDAPVSSPSGSPTGTPAGKVDKSGWTSRQHFEAGAAMVNSRIKAAKKS